MLEQRLSSTLAEWQQWPVSEQPELLRQFEQGHNHCTFLLQAGGQQHVLKLFSQPLGNRTFAAVHAQQWAATLRLAPRIVYTSASLDYMLMDYCLDGNCDDLKALATALSRLHQATPDASLSGLGNFDLAAVHHCYLRSAGDQAQAMHQQLLPAIDLYLNDSTQACFCHNDLVKENCMTANGKAVFIDWEYAQQNNPWFDIASILYYFRLSNEESRRFIHYYNPLLVNQLEQPIYAAAQCAFLWTDVLWHLAQRGGNEWQRQQAKINDLRRLSKLI